MDAGGESPTAPDGLSTMSSTGSGGSFSLGPADPDQVAPADCLRNGPLPGRRR